MPGHRHRAIDDASAWIAWHISRSAQPAPTRRARHAALGRGSARTQSPPVGGRAWPGVGGPESIPESHTSTTSAGNSFRRVLSPAPPG